MNLFVAELGWVLPMDGRPHYNFMNAPPMGHAPVARVTICDLDGAVQRQIGGWNPILPGNFIAPHGIWADSRGDFYVGEVIKAAGAIEHFAPLTPQSFQKFVRSG